MIWLAIFVATLIFAFQGIFLDRIMRPDTLGGYFFSGMLYLFCMACAGGLCLGISYGIGQAFTSSPVEGQHQHLAVIRDKDGVEGRFFLGSGYIENQQYYFYYQNLPDGGLRPGKVVADQGVTVYQEDRKDAELVIFNWKINYPAWAWLVCLPAPEGTGKSFEFHVPKGTVKDGYSM